MTEPLTVVPAGDRRCVCVKNHCPEPRELHRHHVWPLSEGGPDKPVNLVWLCPTSHSNAHRLWRAFADHAGRPPTTVLAAYSRYVRGIVTQGWAQAHPTP